MSRRFPARFGVLPATVLACTFAGSAQQTAPSTIHVRVVEGDGAINSIRLRQGHDPVVQVLDRDGKPLSGATVTFLLPAFGASGTFQDNGLSLTVETDQRGIAAAHGLRPNHTAGTFRIRVTASWHGQPADASLTETNAEPVAKSGNSKKIAILALVGGAVVAGVAAAAHGGGSSSGNNGASTAGGSAGATISAGSPAFGPPH
jgi:hypothetical protein